MPRADPQMHVTSETLESGQIFGVCGKNWSVARLKCRRMGGKVPRGTLGEGCGEEGSGKGESPLWWGVLFPLGARLGL